LWLDGADSSSITLSGSSVTQWNDKSGNAGNATQGSSGNRPTFTGSGVIFNASSSQYLNLNTTYASTHSVYIVATSTSASQVYLFGRNYATSAPTIIMNYVGSSIEYYGGNDGSTRSTFTSSPTSTFVAGYIRTYNSSLYGRYNGGQVFSAGGPTSEPSSMNWGYLGDSDGSHSNFYTGTIYEFMIFNTALTTAQATQIEGYLAQKWGLSTSLPTSHPYAKIPPAMTTPVAYVAPSRLENFSYTGSSQYWVVPAGVNSIFVTLKGAGGAGGYGSSGGSGGLVSGTLAVSPGTSYVIIVGGAGSSGRTNAYGGGGQGGYYGYGGPGGGRTALADNVGNDIVTAGAGGGGAFYTNGGAGGGNDGGNGNASGGGGQYSGGYPSTSYGGFYFDGSYGGHYYGGDGGYYYGGGGGSGWYGGGGGGYYYQSGAGGSSYVGNLTGTVVNTQGGGATSGNNGSVSISY